MLRRGSEVLQEPRGLESCEGIGAQNAHGPVREESVHGVVSSCSLRPSAAGFRISIAAGMIHELSSAAAKLSRIASYM